ncbi:MAG: 50S ribosomal protein L21 [Candidatus Portnoybacteria bacterium]
MFAVIKTGGKQYLVSPGDKIKIEKIDKEKDKEVVFNEVLLVEKGKTTKIGAPLVKGAKVTGKILKQDRAKKVVILKYKPKKRYQKKMGHRQPYTEVEILKISLSAQKSAA